MYVLYSTILGLGLLLFSPWLLLKDARDGRYTRFLRERFGRVPRLPQAGAIWVHAVSVGEALAVERLIAALRTAHPGRLVVLSVTTAAARGVAEQRIAADRIFYFPLDLPWFVRRTLNAIQPALILIVETEIWPNFLRAAAAYPARVVFINGRISGRSFTRYRLIRSLLRRALQPVDCFLMQSEVDAARIRDLGAEPRHVHMAGNLKFDLLPPQQPALDALLQQRLTEAGISHVLVAGSTMEGEEEEVVEAFRQVRAHFPTALLLLAPRHPQRFDAVGAWLDQTGMPYVRRTRLVALPLPPGGVLLLDSVGELAALYKHASVAFVGGSLVPHGGHNVLEPAFFGVPILFGPYMHNFAAIAEQFLGAHAAFRADSALELGHLWERLLRDPELRQSSGQAARQLLDSKRGATARAMEVIQQMLTPAPSQDAD